MSSFWIPVSIAILLVVTPAASAEEWAVSLGVFDLDASRSPELGLEARLSPLAEFRAGALLPALGLAGTSDGSVWFYGSLRFDWRISERWTVTPQFGASLYEDGDGKDLGGPLEFRSGFELTYRFEHGMRFGFVFYHLSNSRIYDSNPGSNSLVLTYGFAR